MLAAASTAQSFTPGASEAQIKSPPERVLGIGGLFFRSRDPKVLALWYQLHLGIEPMRTDAMVAQLRNFNIDVEVDPEKYPNGRFARLHDPEGNPIELWEPVS